MRGYTWGLKSSLKAVDWIRGKGGETSPRKFATYKVAGIKKSDDAKKLLQEIQDPDWGKVEQTARSKVTINLYNEVWSAECWMGIKN